MPAQLQVYSRNQLGMSIYVRLLYYIPEDISPRPQIATVLSTHHIKVGFGGDDIVMER